MQSVGHHRHTHILFTVGLMLSSLALISTVPNQAQAASLKASTRRVIDPANFVPMVDNKFFPLTPGTTFYYEGEKEGAPTRSEFHVTHETKTILGVTCTVVHDLGFENGILAEDTLDWFAQDRAGNVWYFGEDTKELDENGQVISTEGTWQAGVDGALPGIIMEAHPRVGDRYPQELAPGVAEDTARVLSLEKSATIPLGEFDDLLLTRESTPLDPGVVEHKYYAEGIGFILGIMVKGGDEQTALVRITCDRPVCLETDPDADEK